MRRASAMIVVLALLLSLCACQGLDAPTESTGPSQSASGNVPTFPNQPECAHRDENADQLCDDCQKSVLVALDFYCVNDLHGKIVDLEGRPGLDELTTYLKNVRATQENTIFLSAGDMWLGSPESNNTTGRIITDWLNEMDFKAMAIGNHEYDWREDGVRTNAELAEFPLLGVNIVDKQTGKQPDYCQSSVMVECGGVQIGIIGSIGSSYTSISGDFTTDASFQSGAALTKLVKEESEKLRLAGADVIVYLLHDGIGEHTTGTQTISDSKLSAYYDPSLSSGGFVDLVFEGHTHHRYTFVDSAGVYHLQGGSDSWGITHAQLMVNVVTGEVSTVTAGYVASDTYQNLEDDPLIDQLLDKYYDEISDAYRVLGTNGRYRNSDALRAIGAQVYYEAGLERWGDEYQLVFGGGFLSVRSPYNLPAGDVTYADLEALFPFDNELVLCSIKGRDLKSKYFNSTNQNVFIYCGTYGQSVREDLDPNATYYVVVDSYSSTYAYNNLTEIERYTPGVYLRDLIADYIRSGRMEN